MRSLAKSEVSWLWNKAPKFRDLQQSVNIKPVVLPTALVSNMCVFEMEEVSTLYTFFVSQIFQHLNFNWNGVFRIDPPSERTVHAHYKITVQRMCVPTYIIKEELSTGAESISALLGRSREQA